MPTVADLVAGEPGQVALVDARTGEQLSYGELEAAVAAVAGALRPPAGALAFLYTSNRPADVVAELGFARGGLAVALLDASLPEPQRRALEGAYLPEVVAGHPPASDDQSVARAWREHDVAGLAWWQAGGGPEVAPVHPELALCLSTSGSTGSPKFVRLSATNVLSNAQAIRQALHIGADEVAFAHLPLHYSYGLSVLHSHLAAGSTVVLTAESVVRPAFWEQLHEHRVTTLPHVPYGYQMLDRVGFAERDLPALRTLTQAGGRLDVEHAARLHRLMTDRGGAFWVMYGQTEATARLSVLPSDEFEALAGSVGRAIPGGSFEIVADGPGAPDRPGSIVYRGPNVMLGYADDRAGLGRGDDLGGVLVTGDEGRLDGDVLTVLGRRSRIAKVFGLRFGLDEVERAAADAGAGAVAAVEGDNALVLFVEGRAPDACAALARSLARSLRLPPAGVRVVGLDELPRTASGKVAYAELPGSA
jgi:acyl-coenzyme A synthetase/AMP-(fatty) acid ligase